MPARIGEAGREGMMRVVQATASESADEFTSTFMGAFLLTNELDSFYRMAQVMWLEQADVLECDGGYCINIHRVIVISSVDGVDKFSNPCNEVDRHQSDGVDKR